MARQWYYIQEMTTWWMFPTANGFFSGRTSRNSAIFSSAGTTIISLRLTGMNISVLLAISWQQLINEMSEIIFGYGVLAGIVIYCRNASPVYTAGNLIVLTEGGKSL